MSDNESETESQIIPINVTTGKRPPRPNTQSNDDEEDWTEEELLEILKDIDEGDDKLDLDTITDKVFEEVEKEYREILKQQLKNCDTCCTYTPPTPPSVVQGRTPESQLSAMTETQQWSVSPNTRARARADSVTSQSQLQSQPLYLSPLIKQQPIGRSTSYQDSMQAPMGRSPSFQSMQQHGTPQKSQPSVTTSIVSKSFGNNKELHNQLNKDIVQDDWDTDKVSLAFHSVGLSVLSKELKTKNIKNLDKMFKEGRASEVYKIIANILYQQNVEIDVRKEAEHGKGAEKQMREVWGNIVTDEAKYINTRCYLCGGPISNTTKVSPEMEHKLPCAVFYGSFDSIYRLHGEILLKWIYFLDKNETQILPLYNTINVNENGIKENATSFNSKQTDDLFNALYDMFIVWLNNNQGSLFTQKERYSFRYTLKAYLNEFAYAHHFCNQLKSNHDLSVNAICTAYFNALEKAASEKNVKAGNEIIKPALPKQGKADDEWDNIRLGLGMEEDGKAIQLETRTRSVLDQMKYINSIKDNHAENIKLTKKRAILRSIKEIIRNSSPISSGTSRKKITKKEIKLINTRAINIAFDMVINPNKPEAEQTNITKANTFMKMIENFPKGENDVKNEAGVRPTGRMKSKLITPIKETILPSYVDTAISIFQNAYDVPNNASSSLKSGVVKQDIKERIKNRLGVYAEILNNLKEGLNERLKSFDVENMTWINNIDEINGLIEKMYTLSGKKVGHMLSDIIEEGKENSQEIDDNKTTGSLSEADTEIFSDTESQSEPAQAVEPALAPAPAPAAEPAPEPEPVPELVPVPPSEPAPSRRYPQRKRTYAQIKGGTKRHYRKKSTTRKNKSKSRKSKSKNITKKRLRKKRKTRRRQLVKKKK